MCWRCSWRQLCPWNAHLGQMLLDTKEDEERSGAGWQGVTGDLNKSQASLQWGQRGGVGGSGDRRWRLLCDTLAILTAEGGGEGGNGDALPWGELKHVGSPTGAMPHDKDPWGLGEGRAGSGRCEVHKPGTVGHLEALWPEGWR